MQSEKVNCNKFILIPFWIIDIFSTKSKSSCKTISKNCSNECYAYLKAIKNNWMHIVWNELQKKDDFRNVNFLASETYFDFQNPTFFLY